MRLSLQFLGLMCFWNECALMSRGVSFVTASLSAYSYHLHSCHHVGWLWHASSPTPKQIKQFLV
jgi:hypothetical protein